MVKKLFENADVQCWENRADSRFGVKPPFISLKGGPEACDVILIMLDELAERRSPAQRVLTLRHNDRPNSCSKVRFSISPVIRFSISPVSSELTEMSLTIQPPKAEFEFTRSGLIKFREAVESWKRGLDDFCVRPSKHSDGGKDNQSGEIWFWTRFTGP